MKRLLSVLRAVSLGFRDGWREPYELSQSYNIEHVPTYDWRLQEWQDWGINWGQAVRAPIRHQNDGFRYLPPKHVL